jgi:hypothetical protein
LVIRYSCLWADEHERGQEEGVKDRPCAIILVTTDEESEKMVMVLPVTHAPASDPARAVEIPAATKRRLRLDEARSWVVLTEANRFQWPVLICGRPCLATAQRALTARCLTRSLKRSG